MNHVAEFMTASGWTEAGALPAPPVLHGARAGYPGLTLGSDAAPAARCDQGGGIGARPAQHAEDTPP